EGQPAPGAGVERAGGRPAGWPAIEVPPGVLARAEDAGLGDLAGAPVLEVPGEPRGQDPLAEVPGRRGAEGQGPQPVPVRPGPAAVVPWADDQGVQPAGVAFLERFVDRQRALEILLVPPAGDVESRHAAAARRGHRPFAPIAV